MVQPIFVCYDLPLIKPVLLSLCAFACWLHERRLLRICFVWPDNCNLAKKVCWLLVKTTTTVTCLVYTLFRWMWVRYTIMENEYTGQTPYQRTEHHNRIPCQFVFTCKQCNLVHLIILYENAPTLWLIQWYSQYTVVACNPTSSLIISLNKL